MTYKDIKDLVAFYAHRNDLGQYFDSIFVMATDFIAQRVRLNAMESIITLNTVNGVVDLPSDFVEARNVSRIAGAQRYGLALHTVRGFDRFNINASGVPRAYALIANQLHISPPSDSIDIELTYYARPAALVNDNDTNTVLTKHSALYLYAALTYAASAIQDTETQQVSAQQFNTELQNAEEADILSRESGDTPEIRST